MATNDDSGNPPSGETNEERTARENRERAENALMTRIRKESKEAAGEAIAEWAEKNLGKLTSNNPGNPSRETPKPKSLLDIVLGK